MELGRIAEYDGGPVSVITGPVSVVVSVTVSHQIGPGSNPTAGNFFFF